MKSTGIVRPVDPVGRIVLPMGLRRALGVTGNTPLEICVDEDSIVLRKYEPTCVFCGEAEDLQIFNGKKVCAHCVGKLKGPSKAKAG